MNQPDHGYPITLGRMTEPTEQDRRTVRDAALGAIALVSRADPGFFAAFKESVAGSKAIAAAPEGLREYLMVGGIPRQPAGRTAEEVESAILGSLGRAVEVLRDKAPNQVDGFRNLVLTACDQVASASEGVVPAEAATIDRVKAALS